MLGDLIAQIDRPGVAAEILRTLDPAITEGISARASHLSMTSDEFVAGAVREFVDRADDELWFQLLTHMKKADNPGLVAVQTILEWVVTEKDPVRTA